MDLKKEPISIACQKFLQAQIFLLLKLKQNSQNHMELRNRPWIITCEWQIWYLETNIRQRGDVGGSAKKVGLRIKEIERIYGIEKGNNQHSSLPNNSVSSQSDIAAQMGISVDTLQNYKMLADMIPELSDLVDTCIVTKTTALAMMRVLFPWQYGIYTI